MKLRLVRGPLFLAVLTVLASTILPSAAAQKISETFLVSGVFNLDYEGFAGAFNSKGQEFFTFSSCQGLNFFKGGEVSVVEPAPALASTFCPSGIIADSADNFWFVDLGNRAVGFMATKGTITEGRSRSIPPPILDAMQLDVLICKVESRWVLTAQSGCPAR